MKTNDLTKKIAMEIGQYRNWLKDNSIIQISEVEKSFAAGFTIQVWFTVGNDTELRSIRL